MCAGLKAGDRFLQQLLSVVSGNTCRMRCTHGPALKFPRVSAHTGTFSPDPILRNAAQTRLKVPVSYGAGSSRSDRVVYCLAARCLRTPGQMLEIPPDCRVDVAAWTLPSASCKSKFEKRERCQAAQTQDRLTPERTAVG